MLLVFPYCAKDREQAVKLAAWIVELGTYPAHKLLVVREHKAAPIAHDKMGFGIAGEILVRDPDNIWPKSAGLMFRSAAKQIQCTTNEPFLWIEPDCCPMREDWLDEIAAEYNVALAEGKHFLADLIDHRNVGPNFVLHASGICVYPKNLVHHAGEIFYAYDDVPFDIAAGPAIHSQAKQSELIFHVWNQNGQGLAPFKDWPDVEAKIFARRPKCSIFHSDKSGSLTDLLRARKNNLPVPVLAEVEAPSLPEARELRAERAQIGTPRGGQFIYEQPNVADCNKVWIRVDSKGQYLETLEWQDGQWVQVARAKDVEVSAWPIATPWQDKAASVAEIKVIANRLRQFQTNVAYVRYVRTLLAEAGVIEVKKKRRRKKK